MWRVFLNFTYWNFVIHLCYKNFKKAWEMWHLLRHVTNTWTLLKIYLALTYTSTPQGALQKMVRWSDVYRGYRHAQSDTWTQTHTFGDVWKLVINSLIRINIQIRAFLLCWTITMLTYDFFFARTVFEFTLFDFTIFNFFLFRITLRQKTFTRIKFSEIFFKVNL